MKRKLALSLVISFVMVFAGCVHSFVQTTGNLLSANKIAFEMARDGTASLYKQGIVSEQDKEKMVKAGEAYAQAHNAATEALAQYVETKDGKKADIVEQQVTILTEALSEFAAIAHGYLMKE